MKVIVFEQGSSFQQMSRESKQVVFNTFGVIDGQFDSVIPTPCYYENEKHSYFIISTAHDEKKKLNQ